MDRLEAMTIFVAAVETGSLSAASRRLKLPLASVSRRVSDLEKHLGLRLLLRGSRKLALTQAGQTYLSSCRRILEDIAEAERAAAGEYLTPRGELTLSVPQVLGRVHVMPVVAEFLRTYPEVHMRVHLSDRNVNLKEENVDLVLRVGELPDSSMIALRAGWFRQMVCASPTYLENRGTPRIPGDLVAHDCIGYEGLAVGTNWEFGSGKNRESVSVPCRLVVNSIEAALSAAVAGAGIARMVSYLVDDPVKSNRIVALLEEYEPAPIPVSFVYPNQRQVPLKLRAFLDFSLPRLRERLSY
ncbi:LysR family transcriptional regulator [Pararhizobium sp. BT-229]|uniref:LysR family transcriptional regulator n=1 Tax=Pararhizobium sp. BT-229 TaxID=2986923 RepID=UPI0021F7D312|nr:LysR family transcriptional regulator [Pararhizobium sp. BT-229]MCV9962002.1 LysR family transcriptional regulator [Pararhizobium sp. BT-229]